MSLCVFNGRRLTIVLLTFATMVLPLTALGAGTQTSVIAGNHSPMVEKLVDAAPAPSDQKLTIRIDLNPSHRDALESLLAAQQDPSSPSYHQWLKTGEFDRRFGPDPAARAAIIRWLKSQGFEISKSQYGRSIKFTGTVAEADRAFGVAIYAVDGGKHYGNMSDPAVPAQFAPSISFIDGLDNLRGSNATMHIAPGSPAAAKASSPFTKIGGLTGFGPQDFYTFYDVNPVLKTVTGTGGGCIGLIEISDYSDAGIVNFDNAFSLATADITRVISPDSDNPGVNDREDESMLDIEYSHAFAPGAAISFYLTDPATYSGNVIEATVDSLNTAVNANTCSALSVSIESCGFPNNFYTGSLHTTYMQAEMQNQTVFIAEGDQGAAEFDVDLATGDCVVGTSQNVNELASDEFVTAIGGTQFTPNYDTKGNDIGFVAESVWNETNPAIVAQGLGSGGGGQSKVWVGSKPAFQDIGTPADNTRDVPDISMEAACQTPGAFSVFPDQASGNNVTCCVCGTSLGAPVWAGITELMIQSNGNQRVGTINPRLYALGNLHDTATTGIRDVDDGSNNNYNMVTGFVAVTGFDLASGWGTPDVATFIPAYLGISPSPTPSATPTASTTPTATSTATATRSATPTPTRTATPTPTATPGVGHISVNKKSLSLSALPNATASASITITNNGTGPLTANVTAPKHNPPFTEIGGGSGILIDAGKSGEVTIVYSPTKKGSTSDSITITSNDPKQKKAIKVKIKGKSK